jgi:hypothetical protein
MTAKGDEVCTLTVPAITDARRRTISDDDDNDTTMMCTVDHHFARRATVRVTRSIGVACRSFFYPDPPCH